MIFAAHVDTNCQVYCHFPIISSFRTTPSPGHPGVMATIFPPPLSCCIFHNASVLSPTTTTPSLSQERRKEGGRAKEEGCARASEIYLDDASRRVGGVGGTRSWQPHLEMMRGLRHPVAPANPFLFHEY